MLSPFRMVCRDFILPKTANYVSFLSLFPFAQLILPYHDGKQIALHRISYQKKNMVVNPQHYRRLTLKQSMGVENPLLEQDNIIDFPLKSRDLSRYDEVLYE